MRPDKQKVIDEVWDDERVKSFLARQPPVGVTATDFALLLTAYQSMRAGDFERFLGLFVAAGHNLDATNDEGLSFVDYISSHRHATPFIDALTKAGAATGSRRAE
jgi:hypothetical protein